MSTAALKDSTEDRPAAGGAWWLNAPVKQLKTRRETRNAPTTVPGKGPAGASSTGPPAPALMEARLPAPVPRAGTRTRTLVSPAAYCTRKRTAIRYEKRSARPRWVGGRSAGSTVLNTSGRGRHVSMTRLRGRQRCLPRRSESLLRATDAQVRVSPTGMLTSVHRTTTGVQKKA